MLRGTFRLSVVAALLVAMAILPAQTQPMSVEDYAKTASRAAVMANLCPRYFKLNVEQMRQWRRIAIEVAEQLSEDFDAKLKAEIKRRNAEVDRAGHRVWCIQMRGFYENQGIDIEEPTRPYEEEAEAAAERLTSDAKAQAEAKAEAKADAEAAAKQKTLSPRKSASIFCRQLGSINHPLMASTLRSKWSRVGLRYGRSALMLNLSRAPTWPIATFRVITPLQVR